MVIIENVSDARAYVAKVTAEAKAARDPEKEREEEAKDAFVEELQRAFDAGDFGCQAVAAVKVVNVIASKIAGKRVKLHARLNSSSSEEGMHFYPKFAAIVPLQEKEGHNYTVGCPIVVTAKNTCDESAIKSIRPRGGEGNSLWGTWRYATPEEIAKMPDVQFKNMI